MPMTAPMIGARRLSGVRGSSEPSRTAVTGATRLARRAGSTLAATVTRVPTRSDTTMVRVARTMPAWGRSAPSTTNRALRPFASPMPARMPTIELPRPTTVASAMTPRMTWRRDAPSVRNVASSRVRWATVIDSVLKMTKEPTNRAIAANASRK